jgi:uncharacterized protein (DUF1501 family)
MNRRLFLGLSPFGLTLPGLLQARAEQKASRRRGTSVILYWMAGGPSHIDTYDLKPGAPSEVRGPFKPIATRVPGMSLCELLPRQARIADRFSIVRSFSHFNGDHNDASHFVQTGHHVFKVMGRGQLYPAQGAVVSKLRGSGPGRIPPYVCIPQPYSPHLGFFQSAGYLGADHGPVTGGGEPAYRGKVQEPGFNSHPEVGPARLADRQLLLRRLSKGGLDAHRQAFDLMASDRVRRAFDISSEPSRLREKYGQHPWGRAALRARRLVEAGSSFVTINHYEADVDWWDDHTDIEKNLRRRLPLYDQALAALIEDLHGRGMSQDVLVVACGEFGRSPRVDAQAGRGHWPKAASVLLSGGGIKGGRVLGATSSNGGEVRDRPVSPGDLLATIYHCLGIDPSGTLDDPQGRPIQLASGTPVRELF